MIPKRDAPALARGLQFLFFARTGHAVLAVFSVVLFLLVGIVGTFAWFSYSGYCIAQNRYLSDEEFFNVAIDEIIRSRTYISTVRTEQTTQFIPRRVLPYRDKDDFRHSNPACCTIVPTNVGEGIQATFGERLFGKAAKTVLVTYRVNYADENGAPQSEMTTIKYMVTNCGRAWNARH